MSEQKFKTGDIVELKSGSPKMTIEDVQESNEYVDCVWFDGNVLKRDTFVVGVLKKSI